MSIRSISIFIILGFVAVVYLMVFLAIRDGKQGNAYAAQHHCRSVGTKQGQYVYTGKVGGFTPDQTIYNCDGGEIEIR